MKSHTDEELRDEYIRYRDRKQYEGFKKSELPYDPAIPLSGIYPDKTMI